MRGGRILYLAVADARGHLMRAHVLREHLSRVDVEVEVVTTTDEGAGFLHALGTPARVLSDHFQIEFDARHEMSRSRTERRLLRYFVDPDRLMGDLRRLRGLDDGFDLWVNDSLHPALLLWPSLSSRAPRVVHVMGENLWAAAHQNFDGRLPEFVASRYRAAMQALLDRSFARIVHSLQPEDRAGTCERPGAWRLPPPLAPLRRTREEVRRQLGLAPGQRLAAVYLNPHFRAEEIPRAIERSLAARDIALYGVSEPFAHRPGWRAADACFNEVIHAADVFVSGAGMGALEQARTLGVPLVVLMGDQPEQARNLASRQRTAEHLTAVVPVRALDGLATALATVMQDRGVRSLQARRAAQEIARVHGLWTDTFLSLIALSQEESRHEERKSKYRAGARDQQPARRWSRRRARDARAGEAAAPAPRPDAPAGYGG
ncbi:hypothetical protein [Hyalangium sp.]|uniref:hypothetical protein n=1 Tax=Hyalangium sp. TaxID=2028555 RepID=UPI002D223F32|nr:hypothetical protein [Hyalangium sp.]HYH97338.1 hypothetical protein [Hyalangium sp.]